jgi:dienelactone hydrolase
MRFCVACLLVGVLWVQHGAAQTALTSQSAPRYAATDRGAAASTIDLTTSAKWPLPPRIGAETFGALPFMVGPQLSHDGRFITARISSNGQQSLAIMELGQSKLATRLIPIGDIDLNWFTWSHSNRVLVSIGQQLNVATETYYSTRMLSVSTDGAILQKLNWSNNVGLDGDSVLHVPTDGRDTILLASLPDLFGNTGPSVVEVNLGTGKVNRVVAAREGILNWGADNMGTVRLGYGYDWSRNSSRLIYRADAASDFRTIDRASHGQGEDILRIGGLFAGADTAQVWSERSGRDAVYDYHLTQRRFDRPLYDHPRYDTNGVIRDSKSGAILGFIYTADRSYVDWVDPYFKELQSKLDAAMPAGRVATLVSWSADRSRMLVSVNRPHEPLVYYFLNVANGQLTRFAASHEAIKTAYLALQQFVTYKARDGLDITAVLTLPSGRAAAKLPLIVLPHGGPTARDSVGYDYWVQFFANRGYVVLQPNFRGSSGFGEAFRDAGDGRWGTTMIDDITDGVQWLVKEGVVDRSRVCVMGWSYGGYAAMMSAVREPDLYRCAIAGAGISDLKAMLRYDRRFLFSKWWTSKITGGDADLSAMSALTQASKVKAPMLFVHGVKDLRVPVSQSRRMVKALRDLGKPVEYLEQPEGDHHLRREPDRIEFLATMEQFLAKHNPADPGAPTP